ncbi:cytochrome c oxidase assembly protein [Henriciella aquimarina]|uniref:cytochrome c oxidase assembly protein n=1 Tax=Henriciella aquimarina TaxID=545261 RepID=UPI001301F4B1|nr:cytochrome c oxidase assembly protein [Henriciella aquimarina]
MASPALPAFAHGGEEIGHHTEWWAAWRFDWLVSGPALAVLAIYINGMRRRAGSAHAPHPARHISFIAGLGLVWLSLQSPVDPMAERLFSVHQIQHILIRMMGPMFIALAHPEGVLLAGSPRWLRRSVIRPVATSRVMRGLGGGVSRPWAAFLIFFLSLYFWQIPAVHDASILNDPLHETMHVTMLLAGLIFFFTLFRRQDPPLGASRPVRILMILGAIVSNIILGAVTTLKDQVLYPAYDIEGRLFGISAMMDESAGGFIIWMPSSMMCLIALLFVLHGWGEQENRNMAKRYREPRSNAAMADVPQTAAELRRKTAETNRKAATALVASACTVFVIAISVASLIFVLHSGQAHAAMP